VASTHSYLLLFTDRGRCYWLKVYEIPAGTRQARGRSILSLVSAQSDEKITAKDFPEDRYLLLATRNGTVKKTPLSAYGNPRRNGIVAIDLRDADALIGADVTDGSREILLATRQGKAIRFHESDIRAMGRTAAGVRGIMLARENDAVVGMVVVRDPAATILVVTENGYGKRTPVSDYRLQSRGGQGIINVRTTSRNGGVVSIKAVSDQDEIMIISSQGQIIRMQVKQISVLGRATQGVHLIDTGEEDVVVTDVAHLIVEDESDANPALPTTNGVGRSPEGDGSGSEDDERGDPSIEE
jgi:DNA gyrase subunit A